MSITIRNKKGASLTVGTARITKKMKSSTGASYDVPVTRAALGPKMPGEKGLQEFGVTLANGDVVTWDHESNVVFPSTKVDGDPRLWMINEAGEQVRSICAREGGPRPKIGARRSLLEDSSLTNLTRAQAEALIRKYFPTDSQDEIDASLEHENGFTFMLSNNKRLNAHRTENGYTVEIVDDTSKAMSTWQVRPSPMDPQSGPQSSDPTSDRLMERMPGAPKPVGVPPVQPQGFDAQPPSAASGRFGPSDGHDPAGTQPKTPHQVRLVLKGLTKKERMKLDRKRSEEMALKAHLAGKRKQDAPSDIDDYNEDEIDQPSQGNVDQNGFSNRRCRVCGTGFTTLSATRSCCDQHVGRIKRG